MLGRFFVVIGGNSDQLHVPDYAIFVEQVISLREPGRWGQRSRGARAELDDCVNL